MNTKIHIHLNSANWKFNPILEGIKWSPPIFRSLLIWNETSDVHLVKGIPSVSCPQKISKFSLYLSYSLVTKWTKYSYQTRVKDSQWLNLIPPIFLFHTNNWYEPECIHKISFLRQLCALVAGDFNANIEDFMLFLSAPVCLIQF